MFRWLKDRKKQKKNQKSEQTTDDYGFHRGQTEEFEEKIYHIYEEIPDLPQSVTRAWPSAAGNEQTTELVQMPIHSRQNSTEEGPYMVVPIIGGSGLQKAPELVDRRTEFTCALVGRRHSVLSGNSSSGVEISYDSSSSSSQKYCSMDSCASDKPNIQSDEQVTCNRKTSVKKSHDTTPADGSDTCCEYDVSTSSESDLANYEFYLSKIEQNLALKCKVREIIEQTDPEDENCDSDCDSLTTVSDLSRGSVLPKLKVSDSHYSDEGTLADHSESENSSGYYESFSPDRCVLKDKTCSKKSATLYSAESERTHGCNSDPILRQCCPHKQTSASERHGHKDRHNKSHRKRTVPRKVKNRSVDALGLCVSSKNTAGNKCQHRSVDALGLVMPSASNTKKYSSRLYGHASKDSSRLYGHAYKDSSGLYGHASKDSAKAQDKMVANSELYVPIDGSKPSDIELSVSSRSSTTADYECREVYSPPPSVTNFSSRVYASRPSKARGLETADVYKSRGSNNRLLSDLIIKNYDRQLFIH